MKDKILNSIKKIKQKPLAINQLILSAIFFTAIALSLKSNGLFLKELALFGFIIMMAIISAQSKNQNNRN